MTNLIENFFALSTKLLKQDLLKARERKPVEGFLNVFNDGKQATADYSVEYDSEETCLVIHFGIESQRILLSEHELTFGTRSYLTCKCGCKVNSLYLKNGIFACRKCHKLHYQSTMINRTSKHGKFLYQQNQILKIMALRESMGRIFYRSSYIKRFKHWLELCSKAGLVSEVNDANNLMRDINNFKQ